MLFDWKLVGGQTNKQKFKVRQPQRAAKSKRLQCERVAIVARAYFCHVKCLFCFSYRQMTGKLYSCWVALVISAAHIVASIIFLISSDLIISSDAISINLCMLTGHLAWLVLWIVFDLDTDRSSW